MSDAKFGVEGGSGKPRDGAHPRHHIIHKIHHRWQFWVAVVLMLAMIGVYVLTKNLEFRPGNRTVQPTPAANAP